jgi:hypothetical protein
MPRLSKPYILLRRKDSKTFQLILNTTSGLSAEVCCQWQRVSFQNFPDTLARYRYPKTKSAAETGAVALIQFLKNQPEPSERDMPAVSQQKSATDIPLVQYVADFWMPDSPYIKETALVNGDDSGLDALDGGTRIIWSAYQYRPPGYAGRGKGPRRP